MTTIDPFYSAKLRIERAKEHLNDLEAKIGSFFAENPYTRVVDPDPDGVHEIHKIRLTQRIPYRWRILATEIIEHLRASLDHSVWATANLHNGSLNEFNVFPFSSDPIKFEQRMGGIAKDVPTEIQALLRAFKPYNGGNDDLYTLNDMCNLSKHVLVAFIAATAQSGEIRSASTSEWDREIGYYNPPVWDRAKNEIPYARVKRGASFDHHIKISVYISLEYRELTSTEPATAILHAFLCEAERVVLAIEAESRRIGLIT